MANTVIEDRYFDLKTLSEYSCLSENTLRYHIKHRSLPAYKVKGKILVRKSEFDEWITDHRMEIEDLEALVDEVVDSLRRH